MAEEDEEVELNASIEVDLTPSGTLDLDQDWVAYLAQTAEVPGSVEGVDPSINYDDDGTTAYA